MEASHLMAEFISCDSDHMTKYLQSGSSEEKFVIRALMKQFLVMFILQNCYILIFYSKIIFVCNITNMFSLMSTYYSKWMPLIQYNTLFFFN